MGNAKSCSLPQTFLVSESKRMFAITAKRHGGEKIKGQIRLVARDWGVDFDFARRARHGRIGGRAFVKLQRVFHRWLDAQASKELEALRARIERLEQDQVLAQSLGGEPAISARPARARAQDRPAD